MPYIDKICDYINATLQAGTLNRKAFQKGEFYSLAKQVTIKHEDSTDDDIKLRPFIYALNGRKEIDPFINDAAPFQMYHRINTSIVTFSKEQFGDQNTRVNELSAMMMIVYGDPEKLSITQEDLAYLIITGIPSMIEGSALGNSGLGQISIKGATVNHNSQSVFVQEYQSGVYALKPQSIYFAINYQIETSSNSGCLACSDC